MCDEGKALWRFLLLSSMSASTGSSVRFLFTDNVCGPLCDILGIFRIDGFFPNPWMSINCFSGVVE